MKTKYLLMMAANKDSEEEARALMKQNNMRITAEIGQNVKRDKVLSCIFIEFMEFDEARIYIIQKSSPFDEVLLYDVQKKIVLVYKSIKINENLDKNLCILEENYKIINPKGIIIEDIKNLTDINEEILFLHKVSAN